MPHRGDRVPWRAIAAALAAVASIAVTVAAVTPARAEDDPAPSAASVRAQPARPRVGLDLRVAVPDGVGVTATFAVDARIRVGLGLGTLLGTVAITPEVTYAFLPRRRCSPAVTAKASTIVFTPLMDGVINDELARIYGDQVTVDMAGRAMVVLQGLAGVDCAFGGVQLVARGGYAWQPFRSFGGGGDDGDLVIRNWRGPAIDLGLRWSLR